MKDLYNILFILAIISFLSLLGDCETEISNGPEIYDRIIQTQNGPVQGIVKSSRNETKQFVAFMGLRYVDPPARFGLSTPVSETWTSPKILPEGESCCPQITETGKLVEDEDCLFLNIYVPKKALESEEDIKLPVMVFLHGGGFTFGDGTSYGAEYFMENENVILVTINYRLGIFGFLSTEDDMFHSNLGMRDQVEALKYLKKNIKAFSGDPENLTIFGNSAGSASVHYHLMSPLSKGLFHKAIMQSGALSFWSFSPNPRKTAFKFGKHLNCPTDSSEELRKCLEEKPAKDIVMAQGEFWLRFPKGNGIGWFVPTDKEPQTNQNPFFSQRLQSFFTDPRSHKKFEYPSNVPVMIGNVRDEGSTLFASCVLSEEGALEELDSNWNDLAPKTFCYEDFFPSDKLPEISRKVREYYYGSQKNLTKDNLHFLITLYTDTLFLLPVAYAAIDMARNGGEGMKVYPYVFSYVGEWSLRNALNLYELPGLIGHADELQYQFPHEVLGPPLKPDSIAEKLSKRLVKFWTSFAKTGEPAASQWTEGMDIDFTPIQISSKKKKKVEFDVLRIDTKLKLIKNEFIDRLNFWQDLLRKTVFDDEAPLKTEL